jgi:hypothetical protein
MTDMRDLVVQAMVSKGVPVEKAEKHWQTTCDRLNDGDPLTAAGLAVLKDAAIEAALPPVAAAALIAVRDAARPTEKARKFKAGKTYTPAELAAFYPAESKNSDYLAAAAALAKGRPWVVAPNGAYNEAASAKYLGWYADDVPTAPATVMVDGAPVAPVRPGEEAEPREYYLDPFDPDSFLDPEMGSARTDALFKGYDDEALSAMHHWYEYEGYYESPRALRNFADEARGKGVDGILGTGSTLRAWWNNMKPSDRPKVKAPRYSAPPPVQIPTVSPVVPAQRDASPPLVFVIGASENRSEWQGLRPHFASAIRSGAMALGSDAEIPAGLERSAYIDGQIGRAALLVALVSVNTLVGPTADRFESFKRRRIPVIVQSAGLTYTPYAGLLTLPRSGRPIAGDDDRVSVVREIRQLLGLG